MTSRLLAPLFAGYDRLRVLSLARPAALPDSFARGLFLGSFALYFTIGQLFHGFHGHEHWNYFFNADPPRVVADLTTPQAGPVSINASAGHPFFVVLCNPLGVLLAHALLGSQLLAALLMTHVAAALANVVTYRLLLQLGVSRSAAVGGSLVHAFATTTIVFGSTVETGPFATLALVSSLWLAVRSPSVIPNALVQTLCFAMNGALLPHTLLAAPVLFRAHLPPLRWLGRVLVLWAAIAVVAFVLFLVQRRLYPGTSPFSGDGYSVYAGFVNAHDPAALRYRAARLLPHFFWFSFVAPRPLLTSAPDLITTFMWEQRHRIARYDALGRVLVTAWTCALAAAAWLNVRRMRELPESARAFIVLTLGWSLGCLAFFSVFGDDLLLFSYFWMSHVLVFVVLGLDRGLARLPPYEASALRIACVLTGLLFVANQVTFVLRLLAGYGAGPWG